MKRTLFVILAVLLGVALVASLSGQAYAQEEKGAAKAKAPAEDRLSGTVHMIDKATSTITLRTRGNVMRQVVYSDATKITNQNKPGGTLEEIKEGTRLICLGKFDEKTRLIATRIDIRLPR